MFLYHSVMFFFKFSFSYPKEDIQLKAIHLLFVYPPSQKKTKRKDETRHENIKKNDSEFSKAHNFIKNTI